MCISCAFFAFYGIILSLFGRRAKEDSEVMTAMTIKKTVWFLWAASSIGFAASSAFTNVHGEPLTNCSSAGMALTGFTREGRCIDNQDDGGSHHVCIDLSSTTGGQFCQVTKQPDWCSTSMSCHEDTSKKCPIQNWCVCEW